jgi:hypothetical protein
MSEVSAIDPSDQPPLETPLPNVTQTAMGVIPNPCTGPFQTPSFIIVDMETVPYQFGRQDEDLYILNLSLRDQANDNNLRCDNLGPYNMDDWQVDTCKLEDGSGSANRVIGGNILTQTRLRVQSPEPGDDERSTLHIYQYWYCRVNDTSYP